MEPESSLPHSQVPATCPYPQPAQSNPCLRITLAEYISPHIAGQNCEFIENRLPNSEIFLLTSVKLHLKLWRDENFMTALKQKKEKGIVTAHVGLQRCNEGLLHTQTNLYAPCQTQGQRAMNSAHFF